MGHESRLKSHTYTKIRQGQGQEGYNMSLATKKNKWIECNWYYYLFLANKIKIIVRIQRYQKNEIIIMLIRNNFGSIIQDIYQDSHHFELM